jgi:single-strand selective monofunctional uracil DNA glycosylase
MGKQLTGTAVDLGHQAAHLAQELSHQVSSLDYSSSVPWVYNPLKYAWNAHRQYLMRFLSSDCEVLFLGMNPGPWGMAQTGVPFGEVTAVTGWLGIDAAIGKPEREHPQRPIQGLSCPRSEVSGQRLWGLFSQRFGTPECFFEKHFVANFCPLVFMEHSARNITPDKLPASLRHPLEAVCDQHLLGLLRLIRPKWLIGVGAWSEACGKRVIESADDLTDIRVGRILHPSPASPAANRDWAGTVTRQLQALGVWN